MNQKMNHIRERARRMVYEDYLTSFEDLLIKDESVSIHRRNIQKIATIMFKVKNNMCPEFVKSLFCQITPRSRSNAIYYRPNVNTVCDGEQSLRWFGPKRSQSLRNVRVDISNNLLIASLNEVSPYNKSWILFWGSTD